jgi:hypothetical protein
MIRRVLVTAALTAALVAACQSRPATHATLENATDIPLAVHVNDAWVGTYGAGATVVVPIPDGGAPYRIEARSASGAVLSSLDVTADDALRAQAGTRSLRATSDTPCGMIRLTFGDAAEEAMPASTSTPGACP